MQKWFALAVVGTVAVFTPVMAAPAKGPATRTSASKGSEANVAKAKIKILDMDCAGCAGGIINQFKKAEGIKDVKIDAKTKVATVQYDASRLKPDDLLAIVKKASFTGQLLP